MPWTQLGRQTTPLGQAKKHGNDSSIIDLDVGTPSEKRPRGRTNSKLVGKCDVSTLALQETLKGVVKKVPSEK